jgi:hypothetical protein
LPFPALALPRHERRRLNRRRALVLVYAAAAAADFKVFPIFRGIAINRFGNADARVMRRIFSAEPQKSVDMVIA